MKFLVFQHIECEHPGIFRTLLEKAEIQWDAVELDTGEPIPDFKAYDALWVMGGPMDVWDEDECPWLVPEKAAIRHWVCDLKKPYLGFCLGHQLLADALGGVCSPQAEPEIGILGVELTADGRTDPLFAGIAPQIQCLQWHSVEVKIPPDGARVLASSESCSCQAMRVGDNAWGIQFHVELQESTIPEWGQIPAYSDALDQTLGPDSLERMQAQAEPLFAEFQNVSQVLFNNFLDHVPVTTN